MEKSRVTSFELQDQDGDELSLFVYLAIPELMNTLSSDLLRISSKIKELINTSPFAPLVTCVTSPRALDSLNVFKIMFLFMSFLCMVVVG